MHYRAPVTPEEIQSLRKELSCTARELAAALRLEQAAVLSSERAETFPTKADIKAMESLRQKGPDAIVRTKKRGAASTPMTLLRDPAFWALTRKLLTHAPLRAAVMKLAEEYPDPDDTNAG